MPDWIHPIQPLAAGLAESVAAAPWPWLAGGAFPLATLGIFIYCSLRRGRQTRHVLRELADSERRLETRLASLEGAYARQAAADPVTLDEAARRALADLGLNDLSAAGQPGSPARLAGILKTLVENGRRHRETMRDLLDRVEAVKTNVAAREAALAGLSNSIDSAARRAADQAAEFAVVQARLDAAAAALRDEEAAVTARLNERLRDIETREAVARAALDEAAGIDARLEAQVRRREDIVARIDSQLRDRQMQLVTDLLRAEGRHLELTDALSRLTGLLDELRVTADSSRNASSRPDSPRSGMSHSAATGTRVPEIAPPV